MRHIRRWAVLAVVGLAAGCSRPDAAEAARVRAENEELRADLARLQAQQNALRADVERLRAAIPGAPPAPAGEQPRISLAVRLDAASALIDTTERQKAFFTLALDAATQGDAETNKACIAKLIDTTQRQTATYRSALKLAAAGKADAALVLAKSLIDTTQRQKALAKIAEGDFRE